jgi:hypothetical protein
VLVVIAVGVVVVLVAMFGFSTLTDFSGVCAPWSFVMFTSGAMVMLPFAGTVGIGADDAYGLGGFSADWESHHLDGGGRFLLEDRVQVELLTIHNVPFALSILEAEQAGRKD